MTSFKERVGSYFGYHPTVIPLQQKIKKTDSLEARAQVVTPSKRGLLCLVGVATAAIFVGMNLLRSTQERKDHLIIPFGEERENASTALLSVVASGIATLVTRVNTTFSQAVQMDATAFVSKLVKSQDLRQGQDMQLLCQQIGDPRIQFSRDKCYLKKFWDFSYMSCDRVGLYEDALLTRESSKIPGQERLAQQLLLQYATLEDLRRIQSALDFPLMHAVVSDVKSGNWKELFGRYFLDKTELPYILLAAYCQTKIKLNELVPAIYFHFAYVKFSGRVKFLSIFQMENLGGQKLFSGNRIKWLNRPEQLEKNQQTVMVIDCELLGKSKTYFFIELPGMTYLKTANGTDCLLMSDRWISAFYAKQQRYLIPILNLTPNSESYKRKASLMFDQLVPVFSKGTSIHAEPPDDFFLLLHDYSHIEGSLKYSAIAEAMDLASSIRRYLALGDLIYNTKINNKYLIRSGVAEFKEIPTYQQLLDYVLHRYSGFLVDTNYYYENNGSIDGELLLDHVLTTIESEINESHAGLQFLSFKNPWNRTLFRETLGDFEDRASFREKLWSDAFTIIDAISGCGGSHSKLF